MRTSREGIPREKQETGHTVNSSLWKTRNRSTFSLAIKTTEFHGAIYKLYDPWSTWLPNRSLALSFGRPHTHPLAGVVACIRLIYNPHIADSALRPPPPPPPPLSEHHNHLYRSSDATAVALASERRVQQDAESESLLLAGFLLMEGDPQLAFLLSLVARPPAPPRLQTNVRAMNNSCF